jgi:hypothetical protein
MSNLAVLGSDDVEVLVHIRRNSDNVTRIWKTTEKRSSMDYDWRDGNNSCDCNRELFFEYVAGAKYEDVETKCGDGAYFVQIFDAEGNMLYSDDEALK